jgi:hypothetical protein
MHRLGRRSLATGLGALYALRALRASAADNPVIGTFPISFAFAEEGGQRVQDDAWLLAEMGEVTRLYGPLGLRFRVAFDRTLTTRLARLETRADRDSLARECAPHVINVFVVASLRDVDDGVTARRGVHWRKSTRPSERYIIVSAIAGPSVLAHELGHYFGRGHSPVTDNLMSYDRSGAEVFLDASQAATIRAAARATLASGEVVESRDPPAAASPGPH